MNRISQVRGERGLTQDELARRVRVSTRTVAAWESGASFPRLRHARALARALRIPLDDLLGDPEQRQHHGAES